MPFSMPIKYEKPRACFPCLFSGEKSSQRSWINDKNEVSEVRLIFQTWGVFYGWLEKMEFLSVIVIPVPE